MKKIFIYAYTQLNLGDDLFIKILCERYPQHQFYIICQSESAMGFSEIKNLQVVKSLPLLDSLAHRLSIHHLITNRIANKCDLIINIGGSIFMESTNWRKNMKKYEKRLLFNKPYFIIGSNFGPYNNKEFFEGYKQIFSKVEDVCFRDEYSYNLFSELPNIRKAPDVVFTLDVDKVKILDKPKNIVFSVINLEQRSKLSSFENQYINILTETALKFFKLDYEVTFMSFCDREGDTRTIQRIVSNIPEKYLNKTHQYTYKGNINESLSILKSSDGIIATRFHSMILAWLFKIPVYPFIYSEKTENVLNDTQFKGQSTKIEDINVIDSNSIINQIINYEHQDIVVHIQNAEKQFKILDDFLK